MELPPRTARAVALTRAQGALLDAAAGLALGLGAGLAASRGWRAAGAVAPCVAAGLAAGALAGLRWSRMRAARAIQRRRPVLGSALEALLEGQGGALRSQLEGWVEARCGPAPLGGGWLRLAGAAGLALAAALAPERLLRLAPAPAEAAGAVAVRAHVEPPAYSGLPPREVEGPRVEALRGSRVSLVLATGAPRISQAGPGERPQPLVLHDGRAALELTLLQSRTLLLEPEGGPPLLVQLIATPDRPPEVTLLAPEGDRTVTARPGPFAVRATARDDLGVASLTLRWTLAHGRGESMRFRSAKLPAELRREGGATVAEGLLDPAAAGLGAGDTLVVWAEATDGNAIDGPGSARSEARLLRWDEPVVELRGLRSSARLPPPKSLLSEREILARTLRLVRSGARGERLRRASGGLAADQRSLRASFDFFLHSESGEAIELDVDRKEAAQQGDPAVRRLLAQAVSSMWEAEAALEAGAPALAIAPERVAVKALDLALGGARLALRPGTPPDRPVDEARRLTGAQRDLQPSAPAPAPRAAPAPLPLLARRLLLASLRPLGADEGRELATALWSLPPAAGVEAAPLAASLLGAATSAERSRASRAAGEALAAAAQPAPIALQATGPDEGGVIERAERLATSR